MKFRATINEDNYMHEFVNILTTLAKMEKHVVFNLKEDSMVLFICCEDFDTAPILWVDIGKDIYFSNYTFTRAPTEHDQIYFLIDSTKMLQTFTGIQKSTNYFKMKLSKDPWPCFVIQTEVPGQQNNHKKEIELPILIIPRRNWSEYQLPTNQTYDMSVKINHFKMVTNTANSFKHLSPDFTITIGQSGTMILMIENIECKVKMMFHNLEVQNDMDDAESIAETQSDSPDREQMTICKVNSKRVATIFANNCFRHAPGSISIQKDHLFKIDFEIRLNVILHYLLPAMFRD